jgi:hypothetical protein
MAFATYCRFIVVNISHTRTGELKLLPSAEPHASGRHTYNRVLGSQKGSFATLLSPPQCHAAFGTMPHTLASVDQSPVSHPRMLVSSMTRMPRVGFWRGHVKRYPKQYHR